ncbi:hypothetical protein LOD99_4521 [Oopsacas minuta]|uniref:Uncharacterized protein n=1 Tax=Oopsacas minuta TaxID=111878 RepID=A0AAV7JTJ0_9METZ|nr:hypothetical protein LOD99_4521 [Oopsacas minuta]
MATSSYNQLFKILLLGEASSGKTQLLSTYINDGKTTGADNTTVGGIDFKVKPIELDGKRIKLHLWDTAGLERFRSMTSSFYRGAHGIIMVFDVKDELSFNSIQYWMKEADEHVKNPNIPKIVVGNVTGCYDYERQVQTDKATQFAESEQMSYLEYDLKVKNSVDKVFINMAHSVMEMVNKKPNHPREPNTNVDPNVNLDEAGGKCCN